MSGYNASNLPNFFQAPVFPPIAPNSIFEEVVANKVQVNDLAVTGTFTANSLEVTSLSSTNFTTDEISTTDIEATNITTTNLTTTNLVASTGSVSGTLTVGALVTPIGNVDSRLEGLLAIQDTLQYYIDNPIEQYSATGTYAIPLASQLYATPSVYADVDGIHIDFLAANPAIAPRALYFLVSLGRGQVCATIPNKSFYNSAVIPIATNTPNTVTLTIKIANSLGISTGVYTYPAPIDVSGCTRNPNLKVVQIIEFSDFHGAIQTTSTDSGVALLMTAFNQERTYGDATFVVSAGDNFGASPPICSLFDEKPAIEALNLMNIDLSTFGNHEHDRKISHLQTMVGMSNFKWTAANYNLVSPMNSGAKTVSEYEVITKNGISVGFVGMNNYETPDVVFAGNMNYPLTPSGTGTLTIAGNTFKANNYLQSLEGVDLSVALLHYGWSTNVDYELGAYGAPIGELITFGREIKGAAVCYGSHTHQNYDSVWPTTKGPMIVGEVLNAGRAYNRTTITVDTLTKQVIGQFQQRILKTDIQSLTPDPAGTALVAYYQALLAPVTDVKIGQVDFVFPNGGSPQIQRSQETALGDFLADICKARFPATNFCIVNGGGIRDSLPAATYTPLNTGYNRPGPTTTGPYDVTKGDCLTILPFGNSMVIATVTGIQLWNALENGVSQWPSAGRFPQISGFKFSFNPALPAFARVQAVTLPDNTPILKDGTTWTIIVNDFMIYGGDGYTMLNPATANFTGVLFVDVFIEKLQANYALGIVTQRPALDGRIVVI